MVNPILIMYLSQRKICMYPKCKKRFEKGLISLEGNFKDNTLKFNPNPDFLFHYYDTHGIPETITVEELQKTVSSPMSEEQLQSYNDYMENPNHPISFQYADGEIASL